MLTHPTIDQLRALKLDGMADAFTELQSQDRAKDLDHAEWLALPNSLGLAAFPLRMTSVDGSNRLTILPSACVSPR